jgi:hypothetical protein
VHLGEQVLASVSIEGFDLGASGQHGEHGSGCGDQLLLLRRQALGYEQGFILRSQDFLFSLVQTLDNDHAERRKKHHHQEDKQLCPQWPTHNGFRRFHPACTPMTCLRRESTTIVQRKELLHHPVNDA